MSYEETYKLLSSLLKGRRRKFLDMTVCDQSVFQAKFIKSPYAKPKQKVEKNWHRWTFGAKTKGRKR
jgi:hypothetical protein